MTRSRVATAAMIAALVIAAAVFWYLRSDPWSALAAELSRSHTLGIPRFAALVPGEVNEVARSGKTTASDRVRALAAMVLSRSSDEHQRAIATFVLGGASEAERRLVALTQNGGSAAAWNDLAVVLADKATKTEDDTIVAALAAVDRALELDPALQAARFNRALIVDRLGLHDLARAAYEEYLLHDGATAWAIEARERIRAFESVKPQATAWRELMPRLAESPAAAAEAAEQFAQEMRGACLREVLPSWGESIRGLDAQSARKELEIARQLARAVQQKNGDATMQDVVATIDDAAGDDMRLQKLASAHAIFGRAAALYQKRRVAEAAPLFEEARTGFNAAASPAGMIAAYFTASAAVDAGDFERALQRIDELSARVPERHLSLRADLHRLRGTVMAFDGFVGEGLTSYEHAHSTFTALGESRNAVDVAARIGAALAVLGRPGEAWPVYRRTLVSAGRSGSPRLVQSTLHAAMYAALEEERWDVAHALLNLEVHIPGANPRTHAEAVVWRALAAHRAGMRHAAAEDLKHAGTVARAIADPILRASAENDLRLVEALLRERQSPRDALRLLTDYISTIGQQHRLTRLPQVLLVRARVQQSLGMEADAEADLREATRIVEERHERVDREILRDTFLGKSASAYLELAVLLDRRGDVAGAIEVADRPRARLLIERRTAQRVFSAERAAAALDPETALLSYVVSADRLIIQLLRKGAVQRFDAGGDTVHLRDSVARLVAALRHEDRDTAHREGRALYDVLIAPTSASVTGVRTLIIVADAPLDGVPFAALVQPAGGFLIETFEVVHAPGIHAYTSAEWSGGAAEKFLAVGNPRLDRTRHPDLPSLRAAAEEAERVAAMYPSAELFVDGAATKSRITGALGRARVAHFGTHAVQHPAMPEQSRLLLADGDELSANEIASMPLDALQTVVLAGCRTATSRTTHGYLQTLTAAFLAAGAEDVVGSLWDVEDTATRNFSLALHRGLAAGERPAAAMRKAQMEMLSGPLSSWAAFQLVAISPQHSRNATSRRRCCEPSASR